MKKQYGWESEYRRKKFIEKQNKKNEQALVGFNFIDDQPKLPKTISVMLDLDGTTDFINDEKAKIFINQLNTLRLKFGASQAIICISTHYDNPDKMIEVLDILSRNLNKYTKIGTSFYYGGLYEYDKKENIKKERNFNQNKVDTFYDYHVKNSKKENKWFAIIDDNIAENTYVEFQNNHPMLVCKPSQKDETSVLKNNFMSISTTTNGFDGVIESIDLYINSIKDLSALKILETQQNMIVHLSNADLINKIENRDYAFLERYLKEEYADEEDYNTCLRWLIFTNNNITPSKEELIHLKEIFILISNYFEKINNSENKMKALQFKRKFENK